MILGLVVPPAIVITGRGLEERPVAAHEVVIERPADTNAGGRVEEMLDGIAGLTAFRRSDGRSASPTSQGYTLRGLGGNAAARVGLTVDGVPLADPFGGWLNLAAVDIGAIDRVRLVRGPGIGGAAGSLLIDTSDTVGTEAALAIGSRDAVDGFARAGAEVGRTRLLLSVGWQSGDGFTPIIAEDRGSADRPAPYRQANARARLLAPLGSASLQANLSVYDDQRERGFAGSDSRGRGTDASLRLVGDDWSLLAYWQDRAYRNAFAALDDDRAATRPVLDQHAVPSTGLGLGATRRLSTGSIDWELAADLRHASGETNERYFFVDDRPIRAREAGGNHLVAGAALTARTSTGALDLGADIRIDRWSLGEGRLHESVIGGDTITNARFDDRSGWQWSGRFGASLTVSEPFSLRAALSRGWRLPTLNELYRPFRIGADAFAANALLDPETSKMAEVGADYRHGPVSASATLFAGRLDNAIANVPLGSGPGQFPGVGFVGGTYAQRRNLDAIATRGVELDGRYRHGPWQARLSYAFTDATIQSSGEEAALDGLRPNQVPRHTASLAVTRDTDRLSGTLAARYESARFDEVDNRVLLPESVLVDAIARFRITDQFGLSLRAENLFEEEALVGIDGAGVRERARPRAIWLELRWRR